MYIYVAHDGFRLINFGNRSTDLTLYDFAEDEAAYRRRRRHDDDDSLALPGECKTNSRCRPRGYLLLVRSLSAVAIEMLTECETRGARAGIER